jgi:hypothetical protein
MRIYKRTREMVLFMRDENVCWRGGTKGHRASSARERRRQRLLVKVEWRMVLLQGSLLLNGSELRLIGSQ